MKLLFKLAWRNIWRNKRRSFITLIAIVFATFTAIGMRGIQKGTYAVNIKNAVELFSGYLQIQPNSYQENPSLNKTLFYDENLKKTLSTTEKVGSFAPRIIADGLISYKQNSLGTAIYGISPNLEATTTKLKGRIIQGRFLSGDSASEMVGGYKLLNNLKAAVGDTVIILSQGIDGSLGNLKFVIVGASKVGLSELDAMSVFIGLTDAQNLLSMYNHVNTISVKIDKLESIPTVKKHLTENIKPSQMVVLDWEEVMPELKQSIELDNISGAMFLFILIIIVSFGILNTVLMSVTERFNEFGVSLAIGMPQIKLVLIILIETILITFVGLLIGNIIGWGLNYYIVQNPIQLSSDIAWIYEEYGFLPVIESTLNSSIFISTTISVLVVSIVASAYPLLKVYKLEPLKGIRYT